MTGWRTQTYTGKAVHPLDIRPEDVDIIDIAHSLSMTCRFNGHCLRFYSVAEHCVHMSYSVDPENAKWALMHDALEAYFGDMIRPLKDRMPGWSELEDNLEAIIAGKFNLGGSMPAQVKEHDIRIVVDEWEQNMAPSSLPRSLLDGYRSLGVTLQCWSPDRAEAEYLSRYRQLFPNT